MLRPFPCPQRARPLTDVRTVWRAFEPNIDVWACEACQGIVRWPCTETKRLTRVALEASRQAMAETDRLLARHPVRISDAEVRPPKLFIVAY